jgi:hypothetical protein
MWWLRRIAIWNKNRIAVAIAICAWTTSLAFQIHSKSTLSPQTICSKNRKSHLSGFLHRYHTGEYFHPPAWGFRGPLTHCQPLHSEWVPEQSACVVLNTERSKDNIIATLVSDVVLLLTMLVGLLRLRKDGTLFGLGKLLWRQVGGAHSPSLIAHIYFERVWFGSF